MSTLLGTSQNKSQLQDIICGARRPCDLADYKTVMEDYFYVIIGVGLAAVSVQIVTLIWHAPYPAGRTLEPPQPALWPDSATSTLHLTPRHLCSYYHILALSTPKAMHQVHMSASSAPPTPGSAMRMLGVKAIAMSCLVTLGLLGWSEVGIAVVTQGQVNRPTTWLLLACAAVQVLCSVTGICGFKNLNGECIKWAFTILLVRRATAPRALLPHLHAPPDHARAPPWWLHTSVRCVTRRQSSSPQFKRASVRHLLDLRLAQG